MTRGAIATSRCACTIRSGTTICRTCPSPTHWPIFSPKDKIGDWLEMYTRVMELNYWGSTVARTRVVRRSCGGVVGGGRARRTARDAAPQTRGLRDGCLGTARSSRRFQASETFEGRQCHSSQYSVRRGVPGQKSGRHRVEQLGARHLRGPVGAGRRRDHAAAVFHPRFAFRHADGACPRRAVLGAGRGGGRHDRYGRSDLRLVALPDHGHATDAGVRGDGQA